jgi:RNA polymerase sigma-70 factor (ECF subfamily)
MYFDPSVIPTIVRSETRRIGAVFRDEDLEQDAALRACEAFQRQFEVRHPRAFLHKVVVDAVRDHWRRRRTFQALGRLEESLVAVPPRLEERLDQQRRIDLIRRALGQLDAAKRTTLDLFYMEELSVADIAQRQQRSVSAVKMELLRARRLLGRILRHEMGIL